MSNVFKSSLVPSSSSGEGGEYNYTTSEQKIGTWIDGKPLYRKVKQQTYSVSSFPADVTLDMGISNYSLVDMNLRCVYGTNNSGGNKNQYQNANYYNSFFFNLGKFSIRWNINNISSFTAIGEVLYTKTT